MSYRDKKLNHSNYNKVRNKRGSNLFSFNCKKRKLKLSLNYIVLNKDNCSRDGKKFVQMFQLRNAALLYVPLLADVPSMDGPTHACCILPPHPLYKWKKDIIFSHLWPFMSKRRMSANKVTTTKHLCKTESAGAALSKPFAPRGSSLKEY